MKTNPLSFEAISEVEECLAEIKLAKSHKAKSPQNIARQKEENLKTGEFELFLSEQFAIANWIVSTNGETFGDSSKATETALLSRVRALLPRSGRPVTAAGIIEAAQKKGKKKRDNDRARSRKKEREELNARMSGYVFKLLANHIAQQLSEENQSIPFLVARNGNEILDLSRFVEYVEKNIGRFELRWPRGAIPLVKSRFNLQLSDDTIRKRLNRFMDVHYPKLRKQHLLDKNAGN